MNRIYHPWDKWEDYKHGFYGGMPYPKGDSLELYASLLKDLCLFEGCLQTIITEWTYSCEHNLSNEELNRVAYLGQAACALKYNVPCNISRGGYNLLTPEEQTAADALAQKYLDKWLEAHVSIKEIPSKKCS